MKYTPSAIITLFTAALLTGPVHSSSESEVQSCTFKIARNSPAIVVAEALRADQDKLLTLLQRSYELPKIVRDSILQDPKGTSKKFASVADDGFANWEKNEHLRALTILGIILRNDNQNNPFEEVSLNFGKEDSVLKQAFQSPKEALTLATRLLQLNPLLRGAIIEDPENVTNVLTPLVEEQMFVDAVRGGSLDVIRQRAKSLDGPYPAQALKWYFVEAILSYGYSADITGFMTVTDGLGFNYIQEALEQAAKWIHGISSYKKLNAQLPQLDINRARHYLLKEDFAGFFEVTNHLIETSPRVQYMHAFKYFGLGLEAADIGRAYKYLGMAANKRLRAAENFNAILKAVNTGDFSKLEPALWQPSSRQAATQMLTKMLKTNKRK